MASDSITGTGGCCCANCSACADGLPIDMVMTVVSTGSMWDGVGIRVKYTGTPNQWVGVDPNVVGSTYNDITNRSQACTRTGVGTAWTLPVTGGPFDGNILTGDVEATLLCDVTFPGNLRPAMRFHRLTSGLCASGTYSFVDAALVYVSHSCLTHEWEFIFLVGLSSDLEEYIMFPAGRGSQFETASVTVLVVPE